VNSGTHRGRRPSPDGIRRHPLSEDVNQTTSETAGQGQERPAHDKRPQQDSNLRSRLRRVQIAQAMTSPNLQPSRTVGCTWGAREGKVGACPRLIPVLRTVLWARQWVRLTAWGRPGAEGS
jgi:hypothetical protein